MKIDFTATDGVTTLVDAFILPDDHTFADVEIEAMKMQRLSDWIAAINTPPEITPPEILTQD